MRLDPIRNGWQSLRKRHQSTPAASPPVEGQADLHAHFTQAMLKLKGLSQVMGDLYTHPWYLLIGPSGTGKTAAMQAAEGFSRLLPPPPGSEATQSCEWWVSNHAVVIDTAGRYTFPVEIERDRGEWLRLLRLVRKQRRREPLNGIIVTVAVDMLATQTDEELRSYGDTLRERIEDAVRSLRFDMPIYVMVTKCDYVDGFGEFVQHLPEVLSPQALGYVDDPLARETPSRGEAAFERLINGLYDLQTQLHRFRLALLERPSAIAQRCAVFCLPEELKAVQHPLAIVLERLCRSDIRYQTLLVRGVFFSSARQEGARLSFLGHQLPLPEPSFPSSGKSQPYFLRDVFTHLLPRDRHLAVPTLAAQRHRRLVQAVALACGLGLVTLALLWPPIV